MKGKSRLTREGAEPMRLRRQVVVSAEKTETYTFRQEPLQSLEAYCDRCELKVCFLTVEQAVRATGLGARTIFRLVEGGVLHPHETDDGHLLLCPNSVALFVHLQD